MSYSMKIDPEQINQLYLRRGSLKEKGIRKPIMAQVREAIEEYITRHKKEESPLTCTQKAFNNKLNLTQK